MRRKSRKSHCGIIAMNGAGVLRCDRSPIVQSLPGQAKLGPVDTIVRAFEKARKHPELVEDFHRRRMDRVPAEIAEEVGVLFEDADIAAGASEQESGHDPGGTATDDDQVTVAFRRHDASGLTGAALFENADVLSFPSG